MASVLPQQGSTPQAIVSQDMNVLGPADDDTKRVLKREDERQKRFDKMSNTVLDIPNGYRKVEVLIIRWDESIDEFKGHGKEIERLQTIFEKKFHFGCEVQILRNIDDPQLDLDHYIMSHVRNHNGDNNLLIVYYTGHAAQVADPIKGRRLRLSATRDWDESMGGHQPIAFWDEAEKPLKTKAKGDVLTILDCCFASTAAVKSDDEWRTYQLLAASAVEGKTTGPGPGSFTEALCDSLEQLLEESTDGTFSVFKLEETINTKRTEKAALMWDRLKKHKRSVELGPLKKIDIKKNSPSQYKKPELASLNLRFSLTTDDLSNTQIDTLARAFPAVCKNAGIGIRQIKWVGMEKRDPTMRVIQSINEMRRRAKIRKNNTSKTRKTTEVSDARKRPSSRPSSLAPAKRRTTNASMASEESLELGIQTPSGSSGKSRSPTSGED
ncbi:hypothetical protein HBI56_146780 [Parastagonospora nodorum]|nr:hypothetical protein HBH56_078070 [Parastagonospora nodorum]KAH3923370.1 hypothetical protein HBH54_209880 [Parastagonospora nodorum]KAH3952306.1 hypothetical protein HBH53_050050 [Parastagonospora nodorum]KAH3981769.1 hypothetical protein HBH51_044970 [Parastagonospora nodorum]KAH3983334.1 hypothetical protein HBH52_072570 [Parastagonospora nodorum]